MDVSFSLTPDLLSLIQAKVESGRYASTSEVVSDALRLLERSDQLEADRIESLRRAWQEGVESDDVGPLDFSELRDAARQELAASRKG